MKKIAVFCAAFYFSLNMPLFSQSKTLISYPLADGDLWEYWEGPRFFVYLQRKVIGDTVLPNGKLYKKIEVKGTFQSRILQFQRIEDNRVYQIAPRFIPCNSLGCEEFLLYKLSSEVGDTWPYPPYGYDGFLADSGVVRVNKFDSMNFGNRIWKRMTLGSYILPTFETWFNEDVVLLDSIGVYQDSFEGGYLQLRGAIINGKKYGAITSITEHKTSPNPINFSLNFKSYPNPVVNDLYVHIELRHPDRIQLSIFDLLSQKIHDFPLSYYGVGTHTLYWNGRNESTNQTIVNGLYFLILTNNDNQRLVHKFTVLK